MNLISFNIKKQSFHSNLGKILRFQQWSEPFFSFARFFRAHPLTPGNHPQPTRLRRKTAAANGFNLQKRRFSKQALRRTTANRPVFPSVKETLPDRQKSWPTRFSAARRALPARLRPAGRQSA